MFEKFMATQMEFNQEQRKAIQDQKNINQQFHASIRSVENAVSQLAKDRPRDLGKLPSNTEPKHRNQCNVISHAETSENTKEETCDAITLRSQKVVGTQEVQTEKGKEKIRIEVPEPEKDARKGEENSKLNDQPPNR